MDKRSDESGTLAALQRLLEEARAAGAAAAEALHVSQEGAGFETLTGKRIQLRRHKHQRVLGRVYLEDGRAAPFAAEGRGPAEVRELVLAAVRKARTAAPDPTAAPADRYPLTLRGLGVEDPRYGHITEEDREELVQCNRESCAEIAGVECTRVSYTEQRRIRSFASTRDVQATVADTHYMVGVEARDTTTGRRLSQHSEARNFANVGSLPYGVELARRLVDLRQVVPLPPGEPALVLETRAMAALIAALAPAFSGPLIEQQASFLAQDMGLRVGHSRVHLIDDGGLPGGLYSRHFDDRGVPPMPVPILREGVIGGLYQTPESARRAGVRPTGHSVGEALQPSNLILRAGNRSRTQMLGEVPLALAFDHLQGTLDVATGLIDFVGPALVLEKGQKRGAVLEVRLRGSVVDLLNRVAEVASDQERHGAVDCATTLIKGFPVAG